MDLTLLWAGIIALVIFAYVILDGFDLGIGILFPWITHPKQRDTMMMSVAPFWDGNETWLVLGGGALMAAFPLAYSILMPSFYMPLIVMLLALVFRGVAFEFRFKSQTSRAWWDLAFSLGSATASFCQGLILGTYLQGFQLQQEQLVAQHWLSPFSLLCGFAVMAAYALLAATWLNMKTTGSLQNTMKKLAQILLLLVMLSFAIVSLWTAATQDDIATIWFSWPNLLWLSPLPIGAALCALLIFIRLKKGQERTPFYASIVLLFLAFVGCLISIFPYIVPRQLTIWQTAADVNSQQFLLVGVVVFLPIIIAYTAYNYSVFSGKVVIDEY